MSLKETQAQLMEQQLMKLDISHQLKMNHGKDISSELEVCKEKLRIAQREKREMWTALSDNCRYSYRGNNLFCWNKGTKSNTCAMRTCPLLPKNAKKTIQRTCSTCHVCGGKRTVETYFDAGDHFSAGTSSNSEWHTHPCPVCGERQNETN